MTTKALAVLGMHSPGQSALPAGTHWMPKKLKALTLDYVGFPLF